MVKLGIKDNCPFGYFPNDVTCLKLVFVINIQKNPHIKKYRDLAMHTLIISSPNLQLLTDYHGLIVKQPWGTKYL